MSTKSKKSAVDTATKADILSRAAQVDVESIRTNLAAVKTQVARQLVDIEEELVVNAEMLQAVTAAIEIKQQEMKDLHGADQVLMSIDDLRVKLAEEKAKFEAEKRALEEETVRLKDEAEAAQERAQDEYAYNVAQDRKRDLDVWSDQKAQRARTENLRIQDFERDLALRTAALTEKEAVYANAIAQAATFDAKVDEAAAEKAKAQVDAISRNHKHATEITKAGTDAQISGLQKDIAHRDQTIQKLEAQLAAALAQVSESTKAQSDLAKATVDLAAEKSAKADVLSIVAGASSGNGARPRS